MGGFYNPENKVALITGGTSGIGEACARKLAFQGSQVICAGRNKDKAAWIDKEPRIQYISADISNPISISCLFDDIEADYEGLHILINAAGINRDGLLLSLSYEDIKAVIDTNLLGTILCTKEAWKRFMKKQREGVVLNISSIVGNDTGSVGQGNYAASKAGISGFTIGEVQELAKRRVRINEIRPGYIVTPMTDKLDDKRKEAILSRIPLGRFGQPEEVAEMAFSLIMNEYATGSVVRLDGGLTI